MSNKNTELNDLQLQRRSFEDQLIARRAGDEEACGSIGIEYLMALE
jgi:lysyl-tRNA synthetase class II